MSATEDGDANDMSEGGLGGGASSCFLMRCDTTPTPTQSPNTLMTVLKRSLHRNKRKTGTRKQQTEVEKCHTTATTIFVNCTKEERKETQLDH